MRNKHGFTLIELLAVIVVLAIIALIATPIVMNTINNAKKGAAERSGENYIKQVEVAIATKRLEESTSNLSSLDGTYTINSDGNLEKDGLSEPLVIEVSGNRPTSGTIIVKDGIVQNSSFMTIGDYTVSYSDGKCSAIIIATQKITYNLTNVSGSDDSAISSTDTKTLVFTANDGYALPESITVTGATYTWNKDTGTLVLSKATGDVTVTISGTKKYANGEVVYLDVTTGATCTDYKDSNSKTGYNGINPNSDQTSCLKFYIFNDDGEDTISLILDHNTTAVVKWNSNVINADGPKEVLTKLQKDTSSWVGTITPSNYTMVQTGQTSNANYTIKYKDEGYKARLITAGEIAKITGNTSLKEETASKTYYFDSNGSSANTKCRNGNITGCKYGWLYDRTRTNCATYGCSNNADSEMTGYGYWTASSLASSSSGAWVVYYMGTMGSEISGNPNYGVRPVIEILKSNLS